MNRKLFATAAICCAALGANSAQAEIRITEWMYQGAPAPAVPPEAGEFIELTNVGPAAVDMTGWSYDDSSNQPGPIDSLDLSAFGIVQPGESVLITDWGAALFAAAWSLPASTKIIGLSEEGLGRADQINIYDSSNTLVDRLDYDDQTLGHVRTRQVSANVALLDLGTNDAGNAVTSVVGDSYGSYTNSRGDVGNPGYYAPVAVPEPSTVALAGVAMTALAVAVRRKRSV
jgi:predicted extracellular nuclease